ncbi:helix-turn-helix domain-containing protein [Actinospica robiniae]|uniref:helix-turn-helix domain-containing protein n=1 Tax=Actinospica robiniae TaxID=304901 RepID=UPI0012FCAF0D|nr:helix-turn-helix domain-containing protein [Actinospica robiniae]
MFDHAEGRGGTGAAAGAVRAAVGRGGPAPNGWPGGVSGGPVSRGVWAVLCAAESAVTARQLANAVGTGRESANRVLGQLERAGWARRERGDVKTSTPDLWSPVPEAYETSLATLEPRREPGAAAKLQTAEPSMPTPPPSRQSARMHAASSTPPASPGPRRDAAPPRLAAGGLQELVLELLRSRPEEELSPLQLARMLGGRSQGAVVNACKRLAAKGEALCSCQAPLRFTAAHDPE